MIMQRAAEKKHNRVVNQHGGGTIKCMQFTFSIDQSPQPLTSTPVKQPNTKLSTELSKRSGTSALQVRHADTAMTDSDTSSVQSTAYEPDTVTSAPTPQSA